mgnify:FL=1|jgi:hypothetical protein
MNTRIILLLLQTKEKTVCFNKNPPQKWFQIKLTHGLLSKKAKKPKSLIKTMASICFSLFFVAQFSFRVSKNHSFGSFFPTQAFFG